MSWFKGMRTGDRSALTRLTVFLCCLFISMHGLQGSVAADSEWSKHYDAGEKQLTSGSNITAIAELTKALELCEKEQPNSKKVADCLRLLVRAQWNLDRYSDTKSTLNRLIAIDEKLDDTENWARDLNSLALLLRTLQENEAMENVARKSVVLAEKVYGKSSPKLIDFLTNLARSLKYQDKSTEAESVYTRALQIAQSNSQVDKRDHAILLNSIANLYSSQNRFGEANSLFQKALNIDIEINGENSPELAPVYNNIGVLQLGLGNLDKAEEYCTRSLKLLERRKDSVPLLDLCRSYLRMAEIMTRKDKLPEAESYLKEAARISEPLGASVPILASIYKRLGLSQEQQEKNSDAEVSFLRAIAVTKGSASGSDENLSSQLILLADLYEKEGKSNLAELEFQKAWELEQTAHKLALDNPNLELARQLTSHLSEYFVERSKPVAEPRRLADLKSQLKNSQTRFGTNDLHTAAANIELGVWFRTLDSGDPFIHKAYEILLPFAEQVLNVDKEIANKQEGEHLQFNIGQQTTRFGGRKQTLKFIADALLCCTATVSKANRDSLERGGLLAIKAASAPEINDPLWQSRKLLQLGAVLSSKDDWVDAREAMDRARSCAQKSGNRELQFDSLLATASLAYKICDFGEADGFARRALSLTEGTISQRDVRFIQCLGILSRTAGPESERFASDRLQKCRAIHNPQLLVDSLMTSAAICLPKKDFATAEKLLTEANSLKSTMPTLERGKCEAELCLLNGRLSELKADSLPNTAKEQAASLYSLARKDYRLCVDVSYLPDLKDRLVDALKSVARVEHKLGDEDEASRLLLQAAHAMTQLQFRASKLSLGEQVALAEMVREQQDVFLTIAEKPKTRADAYFMVVMGLKGLLFDTLRTRSSLRRLAASNSEVKSQLDELAVLEEKISGGNGTSSPHDSDINYSLVARKEQIERSLERHLKSQDVESLEAFEERLTKNEAFVDVIKYYPYGQGPAKYAAFILVNGEFDPKYVSLGEADVIDKLGRNWRYGVTGYGAIPTGERSSREIHLKTVAPTENRNGLIATYKKANEELISKVLAPIVEALPQSVTKLWLSLDPELTRVPFNVIAGELPRPLYVSEVNNGRELVSLKKRTDQKRQTELLAAGGIDFNDPRVSQLPATKKEVDTITQIANQLNIPSTSLTGKQATKDVVQGKLPTVAYVHLATHGFARGESVGDSNHASRGIGSGNLRMSDKELAARNPLVDSGIFLSRPSSGNLTGEPGVLTAEELVGTDLTNCQLVTLSACETGLGLGLNGQGVLGLRAAILGGGAKCVLMSLWKVDDDATQALMTEFYTNLWKRRLSPVESLSMAQKAISKIPRWSAPKYWAGWVIVGDGFN